MSIFFVNQLFNTMSTEEEKAKKSREYQREYHKKYREKHRDILNQRSRDYAINHREELREKSKEYRQLNKEKLAAYEAARWPKRKEQRRLKREMLKQQKLNALATQETTGTSNN